MKYPLENIKGGIFIECLDSAQHDISNTTYSCLKNCLTAKRSSDFLKFSADVSAF
jgi:hypothetical protein